MTLRTTPWRQSLNIPGLSHGANPIPLGTRVGNMVFSSGVFGGDPSTGAVPDEPEQQVALAFQNMQALLEQAGARLEDVGHVHVLARDASMKEHVNREWVRCFPDPDSRPARHTTVQPLPANLVVQLEIVAVVQP